MRLSISNIAWDVDEDEAVAALLQRLGVDAIDVAPGKYFSHPKTASMADIASVRDFWKIRGIEIIGMQSLLFGLSLNMFERADQTALLDHLDGVCHVAEGLGARRLVFGSPKNRDRGQFSGAEAEKISVDFFRRLGDIAALHGVLICLEPNPPAYGANFMTNSHETAIIVRQTAHPAIRMTLDSGAIIMNKENPDEIISAYAGLFGHIHASEPDLAVLGRREGSDSDHAFLAKALHQNVPKHIISIEMRASKDMPHLEALEYAVLFAIKHYDRSSIS